MRKINTIATIDAQSLVKPTQVLKVVDYGDFAVDRWSGEMSISHVATMMAETVATGVIPFVVGGDSSILYSVVKGIAQDKGKQSFGLIHFSAHPDIDTQAAQTISDRQVVAKLIDDELIKGDEIIQVGLRGKDLDAGALTWMRKNKIRYHTMAKITQDGFSDVFRMIESETKQGPDQWLVSVDLSVIQVSQMIAAARIESGGMRVEDVTKAVRHLCAAHNIVGFEITELSPMLDMSRQSVIHANAILNACLVGVAVRKEGLTPDYIHPLVSTHGQ